MDMTRDEMDGIVFRSGKEPTFMCYRVKKQSPGNSMTLVNTITGSEHHDYQVETLNEMFRDSRWFVISKIHELWT